MYSVWLLNNNNWLIIYFIYFGLTLIQTHTHTHTHTHTPYRNITCLLPLTMFKITAHGHDLLATWQFSLIPNSLTSLEKQKKNETNKKTPLARGYLMNGHTDWKSWRHSLCFMVERKIPWKSCPLNAEKEIITHNETQKALKYHD